MLTMEPSSYTMNAAKAMLTSAHRYEPR
jgi:hypothetical protein